MRSLHVRLDDSAAAALQIVRALVGAAFRCRSIGRPDNWLGLG